MGNASASPLVLSSSLVRSQLEIEAKAEPTSAAFQAKLKAQKEKTAKQGLTAITFSKSDTEKWLNAARKAGWGEVLERSEKHGAKLQELFTK